jgi:hypothetical protein
MRGKGRRRKFETEIHTFCVISFTLEVVVIPSYPVVLAGDGAFEFGLEWVEKSLLKDKRTRRIRFVTPLSRCGAGHRQYASSESLPSMALLRKDD